MPTRKGEGLVATSGLQGVICLLRMSKVLTILITLFALCSLICGSVSECCVLFVAWV